MARRRLFTTVRGPGTSLPATLALTALALTTLSVVAVPPSATAEVREGVGHETTPGQSWGGRDRSAEHDWLGSYEVGGEQVFCVSFALKAPDADEMYEPGDELLDKWGEPLEPDVAANISYLLLRYGDTKDPDEAAALAHLLHSWTAAPRNPDDLDPDRPFTEIAYDVEAHLAALPDGARAAVDRMRDEAETYRGPWEVELTAPEGDQTIGTPAEWSVRITNAEGTGVPDVEVALDLTDLGPGDGDASATATVTTGEDGAAAVTLAPTGEEPTVRAILAAPAERPYVREPVTTDTQRVVSTGGEQEKTAEAATTARTAPGFVTVAKVDEETGDGIAGVPLELTGADGTSPAVGQDGAPLVGEDGEPVVVTSAGADGTVTVENLRTPQTVCLTEVRPPDGYGDAFDPENPPSACGELTPGETLTLRIANVPDAVPETIPAGEPTLTVERAATTSGAPVGALLGLGGLALLASVVTGRVARRRFVRR